MLEINKKKIRRQKKRENGYVSFPINLGTIAVIRRCPFLYIYRYIYIYIYTENLSSSSFFFFVFCVLVCSCSCLDKQERCCNCFVKMTIYPLPPYISSVGQRIGGADNNSSRQPMCCQFVTRFLFLSIYYSSYISRTNGTGIHLCS
jgi:hypothetical protein